LGTGKYLGISDDNKGLELHPNGNSLNCLFMIKSDMAQKKAPKYVADNESTTTILPS